MFLKNKQQQKHSKRQCIQETLNCKLQHINVNPSEKENIRTYLSQFYVGANSIWTYFRTKRTIVVKEWHSLTLVVRGHLHWFQNHIFKYARCVLPTGQRTVKQVQMHMY